LPLIKKIENSGAHLKLKPQIYASSSSTIKAEGDLLLDKVTAQKYQRGKQATIYITSASSFHAPAYICDHFGWPVSLFGKITVHNFADNWHLGGAVATGGPAQEESLSRSSNLLLAMYDPDLMQKFYNVNCTVIQGDESGMLCGNRLHYIENVECLFGDNYETDLQKAPEIGQKFAVVSSAAIDLRKLSKNKFESAKKLMKEKIRSTIQAAIANGTDTLVTGSFGCGVFQWSHDTIASMFFEILIGEGYYRCLRTIIFALASHAAKAGGSTAGGAFSNAFFEDYAEIVW
jgi:TIGR02452 family protein